MEEARMNCEQVREQLSAYLDSELAREEREEMAIHLATCKECSEEVIELRRFDALIARLPRIFPDDALHEKIFSSAEYRELTGTFGATKLTGQLITQRQGTHRHQAGRPYLVALPSVQRITPSIQHQSISATSSKRTLVA